MSRKIYCRRVIIILVASLFIHVFLFPFWIRVDIPAEEREFPISLSGSEINERFVKRFLIDFLGHSLTLPFYNICLKNVSYLEIDEEKISGKDLREFQPSGLRVFITNEDTGVQKEINAKSGSSDCVLLPSGTAKRGDFSSELNWIIDLNDPPRRAAYSLNNSPLFIRNNYIVQFFRFLIIFILIGILWIDLKGLYNYLVKRNKINL